MATRYVTLKDSNGDTIYPQAIATNLAAGSIGTTELADGAVTSAKIDWSSVANRIIAAGETQFQAMAAGGYENITVNIPTQSDTNYVVVAMLSDLPPFWTWIRIAAPTSGKTTSSFELSCYNDGSGAASAFRVQYIVVKY